MSSSPVAVASSDPGGEGEPGPEAMDAAGASSGPLGDSDVTMTEASEEGAAVAEASEELAAVAGDGDAVPDARDAGPEEADAAALADPSYATESADVVVAEGCTDGDSINGLGSGAGEEAGALTGDHEWEPVPAGDLASGSAASEQAGAEPSELGENDVDATPVVGNEVQDNGVAHCDEETQNGLVLSAHCARYCLPPVDKKGFRVSDLVWGKVKSHPWWPGEIFDPSNASELALKHQRKGCRLVAYFGDSSFAWCDESQLKPFVTNYSQMEKQNSSDSFVGSVNYALEELSRRILSGMSCSCLPEELSDNGMSYMVENAGLKDGVTCSTVHRSEILASFSPESLLQYIKSLALFPGQGGDLLELVIACSQLTSFYRSKGCPELASFQTGSAWVEDGMDSSPTNNVVIEEVVVSEVPPAEVKPKRGRGRPRKHKPEDKHELPGKQKPADAVERQMIRDFDDKKRSLDSIEDSDPNSPTPAFGGSFKIGECIRRAATQLTGSSSVVKSQNENTAEAENAEFDVSSDDDVNKLTVEKRAKRRRLHKHHLADPKELLSQLCSVAIEPTDGNNFSATTMSYFSDFRNYAVSVATEASIIIKKSTSKKGRKKRVLRSPELEKRVLRSPELETRVLRSPELETTDHMLDSYWSGLNHPIHSLKSAATNTRSKRRRKSSHETDLSSVQDQQMAPKKEIQVIERSIIHVDEKIVDEWKPTALVLSFGRSTALPSETDLIKMFSRYGPLKESETEVQKNTITVRIVFKKRADAERAFSIAGKYGTFGPKLRSYRLVDMPFSPRVSEPNNKSEACPGAHGPEVPGPSDSKVSLDTVKVNQADKTEKAEAVQASSGEQVDTVKTTFQAEPLKQSSGAQVETCQQACQPEADVVKKTGQIGAGLTGSSDQVATAAHSGQAEKIASEQVSRVEKAHAQNEASLKDQSEVVLSGAATGVEPLKKITKYVTEADAEQNATEQTMEIQAPKEAVEIPCDVKLQTEVSVQEAGSKKQTVEQTAEEITMTEVMVGAAVESKAVAPVEETVENEATARTLGEAIEGKTTAEAPGDEMENTDAADSLGGEVGVGEAKVDAPDDRMEKFAVEALAGMSTKGETAAKAPDAGKTSESVTVEAPDERTTEAENSIDDATVETPGKKATTAKKPPGKKATTAKKPVEGATVETPDEKDTPAKKQVEDATAEARDKKATTAEKTVEDATVGAPDEKATTS